MLLFTFISQVTFTGIYLVSAILYLIYFFRVEHSSGKKASTVLLIALLVHMGVLVVRIINLHYLPIATIFDALSFSGFVVGWAYYLIEKFSRDLSMGAFISPLIVIAEMISLLFFSPSGELKEIFASRWFEIHVSCSMFAFSSFTIAFIGAILFLILYREISQKKLGRFYTRLTSLDQLDRVNFYGSLFGLIFLSLAIFTGFEWMKDIKTNNLHLDARIVASWFTFFVYLGEMFIRKFTKTSPRKLSYFSIVGFVLVVMAFALEGLIK